MAAGIEHEVLNANEIAREAEYRWTQGDLDEAADLIERLDHAVGEFRRAVEQVRTRGAVE